MPSSAKINDRFHKASNKLGFNIGMQSHHVFFYCGSRNSSKAFSCNMCAPECYNPNMCA